MHPSILVFETPDLLYKTAAAYVAQVATEAVAERGRFTFVLAGGGTPLPLFRLLAGEPYNATIPWADTYIFWGDERMVPAGDEENNAAQAQEALLRHVPIPAAQIFAIPTVPDAATAAQHYARTLEKTAIEGRAWPRFDLVLLGLGGDGHTASLFPGSAHPPPRRSAALAVWAEYETRPAARVTLTPPVFNDARHIFFLVTGEGKAQAVALTVAETGDAEQLPARRIWPADGQITWFLDQAAASKLPL